MMSFQRLCALGFATITIASGAVSAGPGHLDPEFSDHAPVALTSDASVLVSDAKGKPLFKAKLEYILEASGNADRHVFLWDARTNRVLLGRVGSSDWWVSCNDLSGASVICTYDGNQRASMARTTLVAIENGDAASSDFSAPVASPDGTTGTSGKDSKARGIPNCPGDPRCPG